MPNGSQVDHRVAFDFEIEFSNGGGIRGWDFRLDIEGEEISDAALGDAIVHDLRLLMVGSVTILNKRIFKERHKRGKSVDAMSEQGSDRSEARLVDLSHVIHQGQQTYPGLPAPSFTDFMSHESSRGRYAEGVTFQIGRADMVANTGTAIDAPFHRFPTGVDVAAMPLESSTDLEGLVVRLSGITGRAITRQILSPAIKDPAGKAILIETGFSGLWGNPAYFVDHPFLTRDGAEYLRDQGVCLVGIDSLNIDDTANGERPAHTILLGAGIPIVENLANLGDLPIHGFKFTAAPMKARGMGAFPVRAWARLADS